MGLMVFLMVASVLSVMLYAPPAPGATTYGDLEFSIDNSVGMYVTQHENQMLRFNNLPYPVLSVPTDLEAINLLRIAAQPVMTFNPNIDAEQLAYVDFVRFEIASAIPSIGGAVSESSATYALPVRTCEDATAAQPILAIELAQNPAIIHTNEYCIVLQGNATSLVLAKDALLYHYFGLILDEDAKTIPRPE